MCCGLRLGSHRVPHSKVTRVSCTYFFVPPLHLPLSTRLTSDQLLRYLAFICIGLRQKGPEAALDFAKGSRQLLRQSLLIHVRYR